MEFDTVFFCLFIILIQDYELEEGQIMSYPDSDYSLIVSAVKNGEVSLRVQNRVF